MTHKKPDGRHVRLVVKQLGATLETAAMVVDSENDISAAIDAGIKSVAVTFGYAHVPVEELGADALIDHFDDLAGTLVEISRRRRKGLLGGDEPGEPHDTSKPAFQR